MHDEVSETENIRKNLAIERMIIEGCEILLDTSQTFVRQGMACAPCLSHPPPGWPQQREARGTQDTTSWLGCRVPKPASVIAEYSGPAGGMRQLHVDVGIYRYQCWYYWFSQFPSLQM